MRKATRAALKTVSIEEAENLLREVITPVLRTEESPIPWHRTLTLLSSVPSPPGPTYDRRETALHVLRLMHAVLPSWPPQNSARDCGSRREVGSPAIPPGG